jgi:hypothetical protein
MVVSIAMLPVEWALLLAVPMLREQSHSAVCHFAVEIDSIGSSVALMYACEPCLVAQHKTVMWHHGWRYLSDLIIPEFSRNEHSPDLKKTVPSPCHP